MKEMLGHGTARVCRFETGYFGDGMGKRVARPASLTPRRNRQVSRRVRRGTRFKAACLRAAEEADCALDRAGRQGCNFVETSLWVNGMGSHACTLLPRVQDMRDTIVSCPYLNSEWVKTYHAVFKALILGFMEVKNGEFTTDLAFVPAILR